MKKEIYSMLQWILIGFIICNVLFFTELHLSAILLVLATLTDFCDLSFLIMQNLCAEGLVFLVLHKKRFAELPNRYCLSIANIIVWVCFTLWYCGGKYSADGVASLPYSDTLRWLYPMSETMASGSHYVVWVFLLLVAEGIISLLIERYVEIEKIIGRVVVGCSLVLAILFMCNGRKIDSLLDKGPKFFYSEHFGTTIKVWQTGRNSCEIEFSNKKLKNKAHIRMIDYNLILLRQDSIGVFQDSCAIIIDKGDFCIYDADIDYNIHSKSDGLYDQVMVEINPFRIRVAPYRILEYEYIPYD